MKVLKN